MRKNFEFPDNCLPLQPLEFSGEFIENTSSDYQVIMQHCLIVIVSIREIMVLDVT